MSEQRFYMLRHMFLTINVLKLSYSMCLILGYDTHRLLREAVPEAHRFIHQLRRSYEVSNDSIRSHYLQPVFAIGPMVHTKETAMYRGNACADYLARQAVILLYLPQPCRLRSFKWPL
jgi:hypothetical protein